MLVTGGPVVKTLLVLPPNHQRLPRSEQRQREAADESPRALLFEDALNADVIDGRYLESLSGFSRVLSKLVPALFVQALEAYRRRHHYDVVVSWDDRFAVVYAFLLLLTRSRSRHVALLTWMAPPRKALTLKLVQSHIDRIIVWSQTHNNLLTEFFGVSPAKIVKIPY